VKNLLLTGICGGVSSTLGYFLFKKGYNVFGVDNLNNGYKENLTINDEKYCTFFECDIRNTEYLRQILVDNKIDAIIHLAAISSLPTCEENPIECFSVNTQGTLSVLEAARTTGIKDVVFASTSAVYENNHVIKNHSFCEKLSVNPTLAYPLSKKLSEDICKSYRIKYGMRVPILRYFNIFGPRQDIHRKSPPLINYITREILNNRVPILHSNGRQSRDYVHIDDVCEATYAALLKGSDTYNVCSGTLTSVSDIYEIIAETLNFKGPAKYNISDALWKSYNINIKKQLIVKETNKFCLGNNSKLEKELGVVINTDIPGLIRKTVLEIKKIYGN
jgi:UDP-glucose 4-epimerase